MQPLFRPKRIGSRKLQYTSIQNFEGGINKADPETNLNVKYTPNALNTLRGNNGALTLRKGLVPFARITFDSDTFVMQNNCIRTTIGSTTVRLYVSTADFETYLENVAGSWISITGSTAVNGVPAGEINVDHFVTAVTYLAPDYEISFSVTTAATSTGSGGGPAIDAVKLNAKSVSSRIVAMEYLASYITYVDDLGYVFRVNSSGWSSMIFSTNIASLLPGAPSGWSASDTVCFAHYNQKLIITNGINKPLLVDPANYLLPVTFLSNAGSNVNTPITKYVVVLGGYIIMAGDPTYPSRIHFSDKNTLVKFYGDAGTVDATYIDLDTLVDTKNKEISGLKTFRNHLIVYYQDIAVIIAVGEHDGGGAHVPRIVDIVNTIGSVNNRVIQDLGDDLLSIDKTGVATLSNSTLTDRFSDSHISELIDPDMRIALNNASDFSTKDNNMFTVWNKRESQYMIFYPKNTTTDFCSKAFIYDYKNNYTSRRTISAWFEASWEPKTLDSTVYEGFSAGCISVNNQIFLAMGVSTLNKHMYIVKYDIDDEKQTDNIYLTHGVGINYYQETPWGDFSDPYKDKTLRYIKLDTQGTAYNILIEFFTDEDMTEPAISFYYNAADYDRFGEAGYGDVIETVTDSFAGEVMELTLTFKRLKVKVSGQVDGQTFALTGMHFWYT